MRPLKALALGVVSSILFPATAHGQGSITGIVRDTSGAVLPGVTVEAASPALIEKVRTAVTDGTGVYRIVDLRPGAYTLTFALTGFSTVKREGLELTGSFTATVNIELRVGALEETVTVTGESPIVDVQNTARQRVMSQEVLETVPAGRNYRMLAVLIPGVTAGVQDVGGQNTLQLGTVQIHGGRGTDQRVMIDGVTIRNGTVEGAIANFIPDMGSTQEMTVDYAAGSAETMTGGVLVNHIPREGGNRLTGSFFATGANSSFQGSNLTQELTDLGLRTPNSLYSVYDYNPSAGGPIMKDKLWFYSAARWQANKRYIAGLWDNLNAGDPTKWTYDPDYNHQAVFALTQSSVNTRLTWQASTKNKFNVYYEHQTRDYNNTGTGLSPESNQHWVFPRLRTFSGGWTATLTSRLLFEVRAATRAEDIRDIFPTNPSDPYRTLIAVTDQGGLIPGLRYRGKGVATDTAYSTFGDNHLDMGEIKTALSYVTGAHAFKVGFNNIWGQNILNSYDIASATTYRFLNGVPNQIQQRTTEYGPLTGGVQAEMGLFAQDKWTLGRLTLNPGIRFDYFRSGYQEFHLGPNLFAPTRDFTFPATTWYSFKDVSPRLGASYDLFGNGKTAVKANLSRYVLAIFPLDGNPAAFRLVNRVTRAWTDANGNYTPDCDLGNFLQQDLRASGGDFCGTISDLRFGQTIPSRTYDPATLVGWGTRPDNWEASAGVQHQVSNRVGLEVGYFRRWFGNFRVTDNRAQAPGDFSPFTITAPVDTRLPGGGGYAVTSLYNLNPNKVGQVDNYDTLASNYGTQIEHWNGIDFSVNARPQRGVILQGGVSTGRTSTDNCDILAKLPEINPVGMPYCHVDTAFLTQVKFLGTYTVPKVDLQVAATFQSLPGPQITADYLATNAEVQPSLGRPLSGGAANVTVNLVAPGTMYGERLNQLDLRFVKLLRFGRVRTSINFDLYNALNGNAIRTVNLNYASWLTPTAILDARMFKIGAQLDF
ncbi:MAG: hypothetical protein C5B57_08945 [Blastocatellia bacterium]|nr:MAG: hypothetical protein C5B57_08945 [Blastocatellia bacterium]